MKIDCELDANHEFPEVMSPAAPDKIRMRSGDLLNGALRRGNGGFSVPAGETSGLAGDGIYAGQNGEAEALRFSAGGILRGCPRRGKEKVRK
jgi:hypothetical protein